MSLSACAAAAVATFPAATVSTTAGSLPLPVVMVAIAGAESGWHARAQGDPLSIYRDGGASEAAYSCGGYTSEGLWQVNMPAHYPYLASATGSTSPCYWAQWLWSPQNNAKAALAVYQSQGLGAWTTYQDGRWQSHIDAAQAAVTAATTPRAGSVALRSTAVPLLGVLAIGGGAALAVALGVGEEVRATARG